LFLSSAVVFSFILLLVIFLPPLICTRGWLWIPSRRVRLDWGTRGGCGLAHRWWVRIGSPPVSQATSTSCAPIQSHPSRRNPQPPPCADQGRKEDDQEQDEGEDNGGGQEQGKRDGQSTSTTFKPIQTSPSR
jgi:hypothetical protein